MMGIGHDMRILGGEQATGQRGSGLWSVVNFVRWIFCIASKGVRGCAGGEKYGLINIWASLMGIIHAIWGRKWRTSKSAEGEWPYFCGRIYPLDVIF